MELVQWLALGLSMVLCFRVVGTACPAELLMPFWRCPASELQHTFELFSSATAAATAATPVNHKAV